MTLVNNCNLPEDLYYVVEKHVWARPEGEFVTVGMTDVAQNMAKTIVAVTPKAAGATVKKGRNIATVESGKWVGAVSAPVSGEIVAVNDAARHLAGPHQLGPLRCRLGRAPATVRVGNRRRRSRHRSGGHRGLPALPRRRGHRLQVTGGSTTNPAARGRRPAVRGSPGRRELTTVRLSHLGQH